MRKLDRLAAGYALGAWLLVQAASIALPAFDAPSWVLKALILLAIFGFPAALAVGWMGARHLPNVALSRPRHARAHLAAIGILSVVLILIAGEIVLRLSAREDASAPLRLAVVKMPSATSIAVLPFVNMTGDAKQEYFSDGMSEELIGDLAAIPELRVVARASSFAFKGKSQDIKNIARLLTVRSVVEGSVREAGQHLRIHADLINAASGYDLWSSTFDREMTNALQVQDDIARAIVKALTHKLLPQSAAAKTHHFVDPQAYRDYLAGQYDLAPRTRSGGERAISLFRRAIARQPDLIEAYVGLGRAYILMAAYPDQKNAIPSAGQAIARALTLDPRSLDALGLRVDLELRRLDWAAARADAGRMLALNPHSQSVLHELFRYYQFMGFPEEALHAAQGAAQLNPLSIVDRMNVTAALAHLARWKETIDASDAVLRLYPDQPAVLTRLCMAYANSGGVAKASELEAHLTQLHESGSARLCSFHIAVATGDRQRALATLGEMAAPFPNGGLDAFDIADNYAIAGDYDDALKWLNRCYQARNFVLFTIPYDKAIAPGFFQTSGWKALWQAPLMKQWQAAHGAVARDLSLGVRG